ncbi:hypothetical protein BCR36DRAFT_299744 [Piromyces finnis]|uniref:t-SNARE coiled-coil homology domain-containing protein n=1 Tax=Piromyces finnis TaxID=1754191 RepID=A0A1Y1V1R9_9FUNG|nr:hypothetical protein BCR36DRAFT_299744 [Piromyces finnis]|eukprot:ORX45382.1 hypothetical protein BCR36DRAFT_299744 [Piromyces finnis]
MATPYQISLNKLKFIYDQCAPKEDKSKDKKSVVTDEFTILKKKIHEDLLDVRRALKEREKLFLENENSQETAEASYRIRCSIKSVRESANNLRDMANKSEKKPTEEEKRFVEKRKDIVDLVFKHIEECEMLEKKRFSDKITSDRKKLFASPTKENGNGTLSSNPFAVQSTNPFATNEEKDPYMDTNLDDFNIEEDLVQIKLNNQEIDKQLDEISEGVKVVKQIAIGINEELERQEEIINRVEEKVDVANAHLENLNYKMKNVVLKSMKGEKYMLNAILAMVIVTIIGFIVIKIIS